MKEKFARVIEQFKKETEKECYSISCVEGTPDILDDKIGGQPYLPIGEEYPKDKNGNPMPLLIQINLEKIDLENWPKTGTLEIFMEQGFNTSWPTDYKIKYFKNGIEYQTEFPNIDLNNFVLQASIKIELKKDICHMSLGDYRANNILINIFNEIFDKNVTNTFDIDDVVEGYDWYSDMNDSLSKPLANIGGYPDFTQQDPRYDKPDHMDECLVKIDSYLDRRLQIGDSGIIFSFINSNDLKECKFENGHCDWDCC